MNKPIIKAEASSLNQSEVPITLSSAKSTVRRAKKKEDADFKKEYNKLNR